VTRHFPRFSQGKPDAFLKLSVPGILVCGRRIWLLYFFCWELLLSKCFLVFEMTIGRRTPACTVPGPAGVAAMPSACSVTVSGYHSSCSSPRTPAPTSKVRCFARSTELPSAEDAPEGGRRADEHTGRAKTRVVVETQVAPASAMKIKKKRGSSYAPP
jgi:hypothetical protein